MKPFTALTAAAIAYASAETEFCGEQNKTETADYILYNNLWGAFDDPKGHQCTGLDSVDGSTIDWHTSFSWDGTAWQVKVVRQRSAQVRPQYEVMVWLQAIGGAGPLSNTGKPIKEVNVGGVDFSLYHGKNGNMTVYSFVAANTTNSFSTDFKQFFDELPANNSIAPEQYLINVQAGTEPFVGNGKLTVSKYSAAVHTV
ncbi:xyloglucan-specific endo-beta-1 [Phytophthora nicotianae]|nr:xyloglucan-specific endo-beta-1 [Phytophthora nicotianae]